MPPGKIRQAHIYLRSGLPKPAKKDHAWTFLIRLKSLSALNVKQPCKGPALPSTGKARNGLMERLAAVSVVNLFPQDDWKPSPGLVYVDIVRKRENVTSDPDTETPCNALALQGVSLLLLRKKSRLKSRIKPVRVTLKNKVLFASLSTAPF